MTIEPLVRIGVANHPTDGDRASSLLAHALGAATDESGDGAGVNFFSAKVGEAARERFDIELGLRRALERNEFEVHYQPVIDVCRVEIVGAEALIRWRHPERGLLLPSEFIRVAETTGLIEAMGMWVLDQGCRQVGEWNDRGHQPIKLSVNLSARQLRDSGLEKNLLARIRNHRFPAEQLELELTESAAMADLDHTRKILDLLRDEGISVALDDFGTGYASMRYLRILRLDRIKVDREFVCNVHSTPQNQAICNAVLELASGLGMKVLAEGIESGAEVDYLSSHGYNLFQGFYFAAPVPADEFEVLLTQRRLASLSRPDSRLH